MERFGRSRKTSLRRFGRALGLAGIALAASAPAGLWAAGAGQPVAVGPTATPTPGQSATIEVPDTSPPPAGDGGFPEANPALGQADSTAQLPQVGTDKPDIWSSDPIATYQRAQSPSAYGPNIGSAQDFLTEGEDSVSPLGIKLRPDRRKLKSGETASGLLVLAVTSGGPADKAGVKPYRHAARTTLEAVSVAGAFFFPPAMLLVPVLESTQVGDSYDMIVGVDGFRVTSALDFEDCMRDLQPGEIVYLSLVRNGARLQLAVTVPNRVQ